VDPAVGFLDFQGRKLAFGLGLTGPTVNKFVQFCSALYKMYIETDSSLVEINPLVILKDGGVVALDAKVTFDENALYRHKDLLEYRDLAEEEPRETQAKEYDLAYIALDGNIGCMVNGAGLAMATMDTIKHVGGEPANFLDVGGGATADQVTKAFEIITSDESVKGIFVNIFGGIMRCDVIATGIVEAVERVGLSVPLVVRLEGTNVELGKQIIEESGLDVVNADSLRDGAVKILELTQ
jgi:succinyl-CoA synthetase beta subunit